MFSSPPPLAPPTTEEDALLQLRLIRSPRVGIVTYFRLLSEHGSAGAALAALPAMAAAAGVKNYRPCPEGVVRAEMAAAARAGATLLCHGGLSYPDALAEIDDPPPVLWARGDIGLLARPSVAIVGARSASSLGLRMAKSLARGIGAGGYVVASGLARGIDAAAHAAAVETGTIAVLAGGVDVIYPPENAALAETLVARGLLLSEQPMGMEPQARHFPRRNRIVSGLSRAVVVVEAAAKSGSLLTARIAGDQGRDVMAVPGHPFDARASGCNQLLRDGAILVRGPQDVLDALGPATTPRPAQPRLLAPLAGATPPAPRSARDPEPAPRPRPSGSAGPLGDRILAFLGVAPVAEDQLLRDLGLAPQAAAAELLSLELDGRIERRAGGLIARVETGADTGA